MTKPTPVLLPHAIDIPEEPALQAQRLREVPWETRNQSIRTLTRWELESLTLFLLEGGQVEEVPGGSGLGAYRERTVPQEDPPVERKPKAGDYRIVQVGVPLNSVWEIQRRIVWLWGLLSWWDCVESCRSRKAAVHSMRGLRNTRDWDREKKANKKNPPKRIEVTEDTLDKEPL